jgi:alanine-synthesizing transaminase
MGTSAPFPRLEHLPPYVLAEIDALKQQALSRGEEVYDFGLGNPDRPAPELAVATLVAESAKTANHRYQPSRGIAPLREAIAAWYRRRHQVEVDPDGETVITIGSKEGLAHLFYATLGPGDTVLVPDPCYPIHRVGVQFAGAIPVSVPMGPGRDHLADYEAARARAPRPPRFAILNFPHNPTTATVDLEFWKRALAWAEQHDLYVISDLAYADLVFDGTNAVSALRVPGAKSRVVEFFTVSKSYNMAGWRVGFCVGNPRLVAALRTMKAYLDYGIFGAVQHAAAAVLSPAGDAIAREQCALYRARRDALCEGLRAAGWPVEPSRATMFVWAALPETMRHLGSVGFCKSLFERARVAVSPGTGFGEGGEGHVRFSMVEEVPRIRAATEAIGRFLKG